MIILIVTLARHDRRAVSLERSADLRLNHHSGLSDSVSSYATLNEYCIIITYKTIVKMDCLPINLDIGDNKTTFLAVSTNDMVLQL